MRTSFLRYSTFVLPIFLLSSIFLESPLSSHAEVNQTQFVLFTEGEFPEFMCVVCTGPWQRCGSATLPTGQAENFNFYTANGTGFFGHAGTWACNASTRSDSDAQLGCAAGVENVTACDSLPLFTATNPGELDKAILGSATSAEIVIPETRFILSGCTVTLVLEAIRSTSGTKWNVLSKDCLTGVLRSASEDDARSVEIGGFLGDRSFLGKRDIDGYVYEGAGGEEITIKLDRDPSSGSIGGNATLIVKDEIAGAKVYEKRTGLVPLEIHVTLPKSGRYAIKVAQAGTRSQSSFRGYFILSVTSTADIVRPLQARFNVER